MNDTARSGGYRAPPDAPHGPQRWWGRAPTVLLGVLLAGCSTLPLPDWVPLPGDSGPPTEARLQRRGIQPLAGHDVQALLGGAVRYRFETATGGQGSARTDGRGGLRLIWTTGGINGRLRFTPDGYCSRMLDARQDPETCFRVYAPKDGAGHAIFRATDGRYMGRIREITPLQR